MTTDSADGHTGKGIKSLVNRLRSGSLGFKSRQGSPDGTHSGMDTGTHTPKGKHTSASQDADISLGLWNFAYDALRDNPKTAALVVTYESIISQELPDHLKTGGMNNSFRGQSDEERAELLTGITNAGLSKRRGSKTSQVDEAARTVSETSKETVASLLPIYPSASVAWAGICTLTPVSNYLSRTGGTEHPKPNPQQLLLDPILRLDYMRTGVRHVTGRMVWYMSLACLLLKDSWHDEENFETRYRDTKDYLTKLYRKILEFEMNCICASASAWNAAAKHVVSWNNMSSLVQVIEDMDAELVKQIEQNATTAMQQSLLRCNRDLDLDSAAPPEQPSNTSAVVAQ